jgi:hypothetical protein
MNLTQILMIHSQFQICRKREFQLPEINMKEIIKKRVKTLRKITQPTNQIAVTKSVQLQPWKIQ